MPRSILWLLLCLLAASPAWAEVRTIAATGEYRMGDNDTRTDAKRLALLDAKRLALEQAGTYLESVTEVKNLQVSHDELRAYTAGIVEVTEQSTKDVMEGATHIVRVEVTAKIDTAVVASQIDILRRNETARTELMKLREENGQLRQALDSKNKELMVLKSDARKETILKQRQQVIAQAEVDDLLTHAWTALVGSKGDRPGYRESTMEGRARARLLIEQALVLAPSHPRAHTLMAILLTEEGDLEGALLEHREVVHLLPDSAFAYHGLGVALYNVGNLDGALSAFRTGLLHKSDVASLHSGMGAVLADKGDFSGAVTAYRKALRLKPEDSLVHAGLGFALASMGNLNGAIEEYRVALRLEPNQALIHAGFGFVLETGGNLDGAIAEYRIALRLKPDDAKIHNNLGLALGKKGEIENAISEFQTALRLRADYGPAHFNLGLAFIEKHDKANAAMEFREFLRLTPDTPANRPSIERARTKLQALER